LYEALVVDEVAAEFEERERAMDEGRMVGESCGDVLLGEAFFQVGGELVRMEKYGVVAGKVQIEEVVEESIEVADFWRVVGLVG